jgi:hypothetical protein
MEKADAVFKGGTFSELMARYSRFRMRIDPVYKRDVDKAVAKRKKEANKQGVQSGEKNPSRSTGVSTSVQHRASTKTNDALS